MVSCQWSVVRCLGTPSTELAKPTRSGRLAADDDMWFELLGPLTDIETITRGTSIRELRRLRRRYGAGRWNKRKGVGTIRLSDGTICKSEMHRYEAHGVGKKEMKVNRLLD